MTFDRAQAVWIEDQNSLAQFIGFYASVEINQAVTGVLAITAINAYRIFHNGVFIAHGPARCAHGHARVDELSIPLCAGVNHIAVEVAAYHMNSFEHTDQDGMFCAELRLGEHVLLRSDKDFSAQYLTQRLRAVPRYSFQRPSVEAYQLQAESDAWRCAGFSESLPLLGVLGYTFLPRSAPYPKYPLINAEPISHWSCTYQTVEDYRKDRSLINISDKLKGFPVDALCLNPQLIMEGCQSTKSTATGQALSDQHAIIYDLQRNRSGFMQCSLRCQSDCTIYITFDERLNADDDVDHFRFGCLNVLSFALAAGSYDLESFAPYTARYLKVHCVGGDCEILSVGMRCFENPNMFDQDFTAEDQILTDIYAAGQHTIAQNSVDIFMDCPSRERAGWLCDSFFMGRYERALCIKRGVEHDFLENFILNKSFAHLPDGMLPMCYPADFYDGNFIPQWALWYIIELGEYATAYPDCDLPQRAQQNMNNLMAWFAGHENDDGLLESLPAWNFIEWSKANNFTQDVSYPSNMLYCRALEVMSALYGDQDYADKATQIRTRIISASWDGSWFHDHAVRQADGTLVVCDDISETCQYYALFFGFRPDGWEDLWQRLVTDFGSHYQPDGPFKMIHPANAFIGYVLRIDLLSQLDENTEQCLAEIKGLYADMAALTGTLWEHNNTGASCNHGFAGFISLKIHELHQASA